MKKYYKLIFLTVLLVFFTFLGVNIALQKIHDIEDLTGSDKEELKLQSNNEETSTESPKQIMEQAESENSRRLERIEAVCRKYGLGLYKTSHQLAPVVKHPPTPQYQVFYIDRVHKLAFCPIYKAGSTSWLQNLLLLAGLSEEEIRESKKTPSELAREHYPELDYSISEQELQTSTKFMTVRHPFERVLSAYRDKLENINQGWEHGTLHYYKAFGRKIVAKYRPGGNNTHTKTLQESADVLRNPDQPEPAGVEPTFREYVRYLIDSDLVSKADDHWIPYYVYCTPCLLKYQFIAKTETLSQDQAFIINTLHLGDPNDISEVAEVYFRQLTAAQILQLYETYQIDFELFGYDYKQYLQYGRDASYSS